MGRRRPSVSQEERPWVSTNPTAWPPELQENKSLLFKPPVSWYFVTALCYSLPWQTNTLPSSPLPPQAWFVTPPPWLCHHRHHQFLWHQEREDFPGASWLGSRPSKPLTCCVALRNSLLPSGPFCCPNSTKVLITWLVMRMTLNSDVTVIC